MELQPVIPFEPITTTSIPQGSQWTAQVKWDGVRMLTYYDGSQVQLFNRRLHERTKQYPELINSLLQANIPSLILDGEVIALEEGKPSFYQLMKRDALQKSESINAARKCIPINYMVFDLLYCNGKWIVDLPLAERQALLTKTLSSSELIHIVENFTDCKMLYHAIKEQNMEGIVIKDLESAYLIGGKDHRWQKKKPLQDLIAIIGGVTYRYSIVNSLLLGLPNEKGCLRYIGQAGTGKLTQQDWRVLTSRIKPLIKETSPFCTTPPRFREATWLEPSLTVKVNFLEWTPQSTLRHPSIQALL